MIALNDNLAPADLKPYAHAVRLELAAREIEAMIPLIRALCAPSPVAVHGDDVPYRTFNEAARFVVQNGGNDKTLHATAMQIQRASKIGAVAYGIRWKRSPDQVSGPVMSGKGGRPPRVGRKPVARSIAVCRLDNWERYGQIIDAARELAPLGKCDVKTAFMRISRSLRNGRKAFGTVWRPASEANPVMMEWAAA